MRRSITAIACVIIAVLFSSCSRKANPISSPEISPPNIIAGDETEGLEAVPENSGIKISNPYKKFATIKEAVESLKFVAKVPLWLPDGYEPEIISVINSKTLDIIYTDGDNRINFRTAEDDTDLSGDNVTYPEVKTGEAAGENITTKGDNGMINVALWTCGTVCFSLRFDDPVSMDILAEIIGSVQ